MSPATIAAISFALILNMAGYLSVAAILPQLLAEWRLTETEVAWLASCHLGVYAIAALILLPLTDRLNTKRVILWSLLCGAVGGFGFAWLASDLWTGSFFRALVGISQAGVYMPGLKLIADKLEGPARSRAAALYASMVPIGSGLSLLLPTMLPAGSGWDLMFELTGFAGLAGLALVAGFVPSAKPPRRAPGTIHNPYNFLRIFKNRAAMTIVFGYAGHVWETFGFRTWIVAFLAFAAGNASPSAAWMPEVTIVGAVIVIAGMPASILAGQYSASGSRMPILRCISLSSLAVSLILAAFTDADFSVVLALAAVYGVIGFADHGSLGSAIVDAAEPEHRGATLAVYTLFGFGFGMLGAIACGLALQVAGGIGSVYAWQALWITCGLGSLAMTVALNIRSIRNAVTMFRTGTRLAPAPLMLQRQSPENRPRSGWRRRPGRR